MGNCSTANNQPPPPAYSSSDKLPAEVVNAPIVEDTVDKPMQIQSADDYVFYDDAKTAYSISKMLLQLQAPEKSCIKNETLAQPAGIVCAFQQLLMNVEYADHVVILQKLSLTNLLEIWKLLYEWKAFAVQANLETFVINHHIRNFNQFSHDAKVLYIILSNQCELHTPSTRVVAALKTKCQPTYRKDLTWQEFLSLNQKTKIDDYWSSYVGWAWTPQKNDYTMPTTETVCDFLSFCNPTPTCDVYSVYASCNHLFTIPRTFIQLQAKQKVLNATGTECLVQSHTVVQSFCKLFTTLDEAKHGVIFQSLLFSELLQVWALLHEWKALSILIHLEHFVKSDSKYLGSGVFDSRGYGCDEISRKGRYLFIQLANHCHTIGNRDFIAFMKKEKQMTRNMQAFSREEFESLHPALVNEHIWEFFGN